MRWRGVAVTAQQSDRLHKHMDELAACRDNGNWRAALKKLDSMDKEGFSLDAEMYELAMAACARMGKIEVLPGLLQNMEVDSLLPTSRTVDTVLQAYIAAEEWELIVKLAKDMTQKGVVLSDAAFQASFEACGKIRDTGAVKTLITNVEEAGTMALDTIHYAMAMRACGMAGRADVTASLFTRMEEKRGIEGDAEVFNQLIRSQIVNNSIPQALQTFAIVKDRGLVLPESIYTATIDALVSRGEFWQASQLFQQMLSHELPPSVFCYGRMMVAYTRMNKTQLATECWQRIREMDEPSPNVRKYSKMVQQLAATNDSDLVGEIFEYVYQTFDPATISDITYAAVIRAYGRGGRVDAALGLFDAFTATRRRANKPLPRSAGIYLAVFNALSRDTERDPDENARDAKRVWDLMVQSVPVVLAPAYASLAGVLASSGDLSTLEELLEHAETSLNKDNFATSTRRLAHEGVDWTEEDEAHERSDVSPTWHDELLYNGVISGFSKARSDESARVMEYLRTMRSRRLAIKDSVVRAATDSFVRHSQWSLMYELAELVDVRVLNNAELCFGDTISKLLEAKAWPPARHWLLKAHHIGVQPPIRGKMETLRFLQEIKAHEWQIAFALAKETLSFKQMVQDNVECVADAVDVCLTSSRSDLVIKLFERAVTHPSVVKQYNDIKLPLRMYKTALLACMREHSITPDFDEVLGVDPVMAPPKPIEKAEAICAQMLQTYARKDQLDGEALSLAISIKATIGDDDDVLALFEKMQQHGLSPNSYAYNAAIMAYSRARNLDKLIAVRDELVASQSLILSEPIVTRSLLFSLAILPDEKLLKKHLASTRELLPHITSNMVLNAFLKAGRLDKCVEHFDETTSDQIFQTLLHRILDSRSNATKQHAGQCVDVVHSAQLLLKSIAFHGLDHLRPAVLLRVTKRLIQRGHLREAQAILELYDAPESEVTLSEMKPTFQLEVFEMLLHLYGTQCHFTKLAELFEKTKTSAVPMHLHHYQLAMDFCKNAAKVVDQGAPKKLTKKQREQLAHDGAVGCVELFEALRLQFVKPNGAVYVQALQSSHTLGRLEDTGMCIMRDAMDEGFQNLVSSEFLRLATIAAHEQRAEQAVTAATTADEATKPKPRRGRKTKAEMEAMPVKKVDVPQLAAVVLFAHHNGINTSWRLANKLLECQAALPKNVRNELQHIVAVAEATYAQAAAEREPPASQSPRTSPRVPAATSSRKPASPKAASAPGSRWGELYLQKLASDE